MAKKLLAKRRPGRPGKWTAEVERIILEAVAGGLPRRLAAAKAGISETVFYSHARENPQFQQDLEKADSEFVRTHLANIAQAAKKNWTASAWILERRFPGEFGRVDKVEQASTSPLPPMYVRAVNIALGYDPSAKAKAELQAKTPKTIEASEYLPE